MIKIYSREEWDNLKQKRDIGSREKEEVIVKEIIENVRQRGDQVLRDYALKFEGASLDSLTVGEKELRDATQKVEPEFIKAIHKARENIKEFHQRQSRNSWFFTEKEGIMMGHMVIPLKKVGAYVPGGTASYPSSVLMNVIPAQVAGVEEIYLATPTDKEGRVNPYTLAAAEITGVTQIFKTGGAQAIAALAYGTETVPKMDKIVGPGNIYVTMAKKQVYGDVDIDMLAGPSELLIIADTTADPDFVAADLMSQAEHDPLAANYLVTNDKELPEKVLKSLQQQQPERTRREIIERSFQDYSAVIVVKDLEEAFEVSNQIAPEHLEVMIENPLAYLNMIQNAGSVFLGSFSPEPLGDYYAGPNHVLPTGGAARFSSGLNVDDFIKKTSFLSYSPEALKEAAEDVILLAEIEGLDAHANAVKVRRKHFEK